MEKTSETKTQSRKKQLKGVVVSDKMKDTAVVQVVRFVKHPRYGKYVKRIKKYSSHNTIGAKEGDTVIIRETKPISKRKSFEITSIK
ncbi:MAG: 30S ribosomal protein S17 [Candidatus Campbellbacteria bacterium]|nr:30S ribosomal protein S17 [Candidatus Campbellbacteria bacterium]